MSPVSDLKLRLLALKNSFPDKLVKVAGDVSECCVCEVGPGPGSLTRSILNAGAKKVVAVEKDSRLLSSLEVSYSVLFFTSMIFAVPSSC
jgi:16S rRNA A1518/A1519 N6-dimethyltransferase RsmA/KsgA/DIM1 with predicted DNA glycosylase/AP lyase activity